MARESMVFDVVIVGAGPAGISCACRLMQLSKKKGDGLSVCVIEKGSEVGAHILSGAVFETRAIDELFPQWQEQGAPITAKVLKDDVLLFSNNEQSIKIPKIFLPKTMLNEGNYIVSMGDLCRWLALQAESLGVEVFPGFSAKELLLTEDGSVAGVITGDMGRDKNHKEKNSFVEGLELQAKYTIFAEGCRGHLGKQLIERFKLSEGKSEQHYALGFKEVWDIKPELHQEGLVVHTAGWPLKKEGGGGFLYHGINNQVYVGMIIDLNYENPYFSPFDEFQRYKQHPKVSHYLNGGKRVSYGARALSKGGLQAVPKMTFPGGLLVGCEAGLINFSKIKGNHTAMKSGMIAAEVTFKAIINNKRAADLNEFTTMFNQSWLYDELYKSRNFGGVIKSLGTIVGGGYNLIDQNLFNGKLPFKFTDNKPDHLALKRGKDCHIIDYPKPDNLLSFDKLSSVYLSNTNHEEDQPCHLKLADSDIPINVNLKEYAEPAQRYCPAGVYEISETDTGEMQFVINAQNCIHCKTCDIKDPSDNITWVTPEGGGGPNYPNM